MKSTPLISHRLIAAAARRNGCESPKPERNQTSVLRLPDIATAIPLELVAGVEPEPANRAPSYARDRSAVTF
jgi:hypothetical protein